MKIAIDQLYEVREIFDSIKAEYENEPVLLSAVIREIQKSVDKALKLVCGEKV